MSSVDATHAVFGYERQPAVIGASVADGPTDASDGYAGASGSHANASNAIERRTTHTACERTSAQPLV